MENIIITFDDNQKREYPSGVTLKEILIDYDTKDEIVCAKFNNHVISLNEPITRNGSLVLFGINDSFGNRVYEKGLTFLFVVCAKQILPDAEIRIRHSIDRGVFFEVNGKFDSESVNEIKKLMKDKISKKIPFVRVETTLDEAITYFKNVKRYDKVSTLFYAKSSYVTLYRLDDVYDYILGDLPADTSILKYFDLTLIPDKGIILRYPSIYDNGKILKYTHHEQYFNSIDEYLSWAKILNISSVGELNDAIVSSKKGEIIHLSEAIQDFRLHEIAKQIADNKEMKFVLISGPSSSGKTTSARKLSLYLKTLGLNPVPVSLDDYFLNREDTPLTEDGKYDFESLRAIDIKLFNNQMSKLLKGNKILAPTFDFVEGKKVFDKTLQMKENDVLVIEGLHALSEELLADIPKKKKFKIYISPLVYINIDDDNRINLTDIRLLRRMTRDSRTRGYSPSHTLNSWKDVRKGEEKHVFQYQDNADVIFNTFLVYELAVLKAYAEPLLHQVKDDDPEYLTAKRLIKLLSLVLPIPSEDVPAVSILREFIGGSYFE